MTNIWKILIAASLVLSIVTAVFDLVPLFQARTFGSLGVKLAENYDPYLRYNGGYYSALPIRTTSTLTVDSTTVLTGAVTLTAGFTASTTGTRVNGINYGTCNLGAGGAASFALASWASKAIDCGSGANGLTAITGILAGDTIEIHGPTTTPANANSLIVTGLAASSTPGFITLELTNASTTAITLTSTATSSWQYIDFH